ncbi:MAG: hypothetical protein H0X73_03280 [Chthoniobacterales bacterium]|nr:hypothetical protein [Chthoniobacterales bacterium]
MAIRRTLTSEDKLDALRKGDPAIAWKSLDDRRVCILCERTFSGRQVDASVTPAGRVRLRCPSEGCVGTPHVWVRPGNPLVSKDVWADWTRVLDGATTAAHQN